MKKFLLSLAVVLGVSGFAHAEGTTLVMKDFYNITATGAAPETQKSGDYTITVSKNGGSTAPACNKAGDLRLYAKNAITIASSGADITSLSFELSAQGKKQYAKITASVGTVGAQAQGDEAVTWSGNAKEVTFTVGDTNDYGTDTKKGSGQFDINSISINGGGEVTPPAPVETVKVANIAAFLADPNTTDTYEFTTPVTVVYQYNYTSASGNPTYNLYIQDATGGLLVFGDTKQTYKQGDVIEAGFTGKYKNYNGCVELVDGAGFTAATRTSAVEAAVYAVEDISLDNGNQYISINGADITAGADAKNFVITQDGTTIPMYNKFDIEINADANCNIWGVVNIYKGKEDPNPYAQIYPIKIENASGETKLPAGLAFSLSALTVNLGDNFEIPALSKATTAEVVYSSSNEAVATVDAVTGAVTVLSTGTTTISAVAEANEEYYGGSASYTLTVTGNVTVEKVSAIADGKYAFVFPAGIATPIDEKFKYGYCYLEDVTLNGDAASTEATNLFTFTNTDKGYTIADTFGRYLGMDETHSGSFNVYATADEGNSYWTVTFDGENAKIENAGRAGFFIAYTEFTDKNGNVKHEMIPTDKSTVFPVLYMLKGAGVEAVVADDAEAPVEYYNLQGVRVAEPESGLYIRRQGNKVEKVVIR